MFRTFALSIFAFVYSASSYGFTITIDGSKLAGDPSRWDILSEWDQTIQTPSDQASWNTMVKTYEFDPGTYSVGYFSGINSSPSGPVSFTVDASGVLTLNDPLASSFAKVTTSTTLTLSGIPVSFTSQLSKDVLDVMGLTEWSQTTEAQATTLNLLPGTYSIGYYAGIGWITTSFNVGASGTVTFSDPAVNAYMSTTDPVGSSPALLNLKGFPIQVMSKLTAPWFELDSIWDFFTDSMNGQAFTVNLLPGDYGIHYNVTLSDLSRGRISTSFTVDTNGMVVVSPSLSPAVTSTGPTLHLNGVALTIDSGLSVGTMQLTSIVDWSQTTLGQGALHAVVLPGMHTVGYRTSDISGNYTFAGVDFTVGRDGTVSSDPSYAKILSTGPNLLTITGMAITMDFTQLVSSTFFTLSSIIDLSNTVPQVVNLLPGTQGFQSSGATFNMTLQPDAAGNASMIFDPALNQVVTGNGTAKITFVNPLLNEQAKLVADQTTLSNANNQLSADNAQLAADLQLTAVLSPEQLKLNLDTSKLAADQKPIVDATATLNADRSQLKADTAQTILYKLQWAADLKVLLKDRKDLKAQVKFLDKDQATIDTLVASQFKKPTAANQKKLEDAQKLLVDLQSTANSEKTKLTSDLQKVTTELAQVDQAKAKVKTDRAQIQADIANLKNERLFLKALLNNDKKLIREDLKHVAQSSNAVLIATDQAAVDADQALVTANQAMLTADQAQLATDEAKLNQLLLK